MPASKADNLRKKEMVAYFDKKTSLWKLKWEGGGELPESCKGSFTTKDLADYSAKLYKASI